MINKGEVKLSKMVPGDYGTINKWLLQLKTHGLPGGHETDLYLHYHGSVDQCDLPVDISDVPEIMIDDLGVANLFK